MKRFASFLAVAALFLAALAIQRFAENRNFQQVTLQIRLTPQVAVTELSPLKTVSLPELPPAAKRNALFVRSATEIYQEANSYTATIIVQFEDPTGNPLNPNFPHNEGEGSGFIIESGTIPYVVSVNHAIPRSKNFKNLHFFAQFNDHQRQELDVVGYNKTPLDVAIFKFKNLNFRPKAKAKIGDSRLLAVGDPILAVGSPYGVFNFLTSGVIGAIDLQNARGYWGPGLIGSGIHISPGNSGGPLLNYSGEVIGLNQRFNENNPLIYGQAPIISLSTPMHDIETIMPDLLKGEVKVGWLEYHIQNSWDLPQHIREALGLDEASPKGPLVIADASAISQVLPLGMIYSFISKRLRQGDLIVKYAGNPVKSLSEVLRINLRLRPGDRVEVIVLRNKKRVRKEITLIEFPPDSAEPDSKTEEILPKIFKTSP